MSDDYVCAGRRKSKGDKRAKGRFMRYKRGGAQRVTGIVFSSSDKVNK
jgi:hypothetical protein